MHFSENFVSMTFQDNRFAERYRKSKKIEKNRRMKKWTRQWFGGRVYISKKKRFLTDIYEKYLSDLKMFVHKVKGREKCYFFYFLHKSLAQKLWKIWLIIGLGRVSRDVMRLH